MNRPVVEDQIEVLLLLPLTVLQRNLSSPIPCPGSAPVDPIWNLGDVLLLPLLGSTTSFTPSCPLTLTSELSVVGSADGMPRARRLARSSRGDISSPLFNVARHRLLPVAVMACVLSHAALLCHHGYVPHRCLGRPVVA